LARRDYGIVPLWAINSRVGINLPWCALAVFSLIMHRLMIAKAGAEHVGHDLWHVVLNGNGRDMFKLSLSEIARITGLSRRAAFEGKQILWRERIILPVAANDGRDYLWPNSNFIVCSG
jgi:hypothetical protein